MPLLTRDGILSASRRLIDNNGIFGRLELMLSHVLSALDEPQASTRSKAIKALSVASHQPNSPVNGAFGIINISCAFASALSATASLYH